MTGATLLRSRPSIMDSFRRHDDRQPARVAWLWQRDTRQETKGIPRERTAPPAVLDAKRQLDDLTMDGYLSRATSSHVLRFLTLVSTHWTPPTHIAPEEGVAVLFWVAGDKALTVDVTDEGADIVVVSDPDLGTRTAKTPQAIYQLTESTLADLCMRAREGARVG